MVDLHCHSCFSFLDGASHPEELLDRAVELGYTALALTDHNGVYGSLEFALAAKEREIQAITGAEVTLEDESHLTLLVEKPEGYANLCRLLTLAHRSGERRFPHLPYAALPEHARGLIALSGCRLGEVPRLLAEGKPLAAERAAARYREWFGEDRFFLELQQNLAYGDTQRCRELAALGQKLRLPLVATNNTHYHVRERHRLQDTLVAIRHGMTLDEAHPYRRPNSEFALKSPEAFRQRFRSYPEAVENALAIAARCYGFDLLSDLGYQFPDFVRDASDDQFRTGDEALRILCEEALEVKYADAPPERKAEAKRWLARELELVQMHGLAGFFLVYRDLLQLSKEVAAELRGTGPRGRFELPPGRGRGSAVSSIICYLIGLSPVDPVKAKLFPGRFLNESLRSVPDIDLDFPRDIRAELIKRVHQRYGADHVAMVNIMPTYRFRGAVREVGKALALPPAELDRLAKLGSGYSEIEEEMTNGPDAFLYQDHPLWTHLRELSAELRGMPRHVSQHVGGILISSRPLIEVVPLEHSAMEGRQVCQWDKDSCDTARMVKIDFLALGMLSAVEECLELIEANGKEPVDLSRIEFNDPKVYNRICKGETIGAFQIESRAQIGMLVRTLPRTIEDLAVQVAIVRPGPIVGNAVNPYVRRREEQRRRKHYRAPLDHPLLADALGDTLGIIIYQDQVMEVSKALAGFTDGQADELRRAMSRKRSRENMEKFRTLFMEGAAARGVAPEVAVRVFEQVTAFSEFGFPKSHAAAFAILAYQSMWLLHYHHAEFVASVLNNHPMGFYSRDTLVHDAQRHGVSFLAPDINQSELKCTVHGKVVRFGISAVEGVGETKAKLILAERAREPFHSLPDFVRRMRLPTAVTERLILAGAFDAFGMNRRELVWQLGLLPKQPGLELPTEQDQVTLASAGRWERLTHDYRLLATSMEGHPMQMLRRYLPDKHRVRDLRQCEHGQTVTIAGIVTTRQRPATAKGILFLLIEDETGMVNVVVRRDLHEQNRETYRGHPLLVLKGTVDRSGRQINLVAEKAWPLREEFPDPAKNPVARHLYQAVMGFPAPPSHNFR